MGSVTACMMDVITEKSGHSMTGLAVSVCLTPAAPAPLPIPYPTMASVSEGVIDECLRTKIDGAKVLTVGSCTKNCHGNEPGTLKEVVSLNTAGPCFPIMGAPIVFIELGMAGITLSPGFMNKNPIPGIGGSASGAGGGGGGGGGAGGGAGGPPGSSTSGPSNGGGGGGGSNSGAAPPSPPGAPGAEGQATAGHPVDVVTGAMFTGPIADFTLLGFFVVQFTRSYSTSSVERDCGMGFGWSNALHWTARTQGEKLTLVDDEGRETVMPLPSGKEAVELPYGRSVRRAGDEVIIDAADGLSRVLRAEAGGARNRLLLAELRDKHGHVAEIEWEDGEVVAISDTVGRHARRTKEGLWRRWEATVTDAAGREHRKHLVAYELNDRRELVTVIDAGGVETRYEYDEDHYLVTESRADGMVWHFVYANHEGKRLCVETWGDMPGRDVLSLLGDPQGGSARGVYHARLSYGPDPYQSTVTNALGYVHRYWGNALGLVQRYLDPRGVDHLYSYDAAGRLLRVTVGGLSEVRQVGQSGAVTGYAGPAGDGLRSTYDAEAQVNEVRFSGGRRMKQRLSGGKIVEVVDELGRKHQTKWNEHGLKEAIIGPAGAADEISYDAHGNIAQFTTAKGAVWKYTWDLFGLPVRLQTPNGGEYELRYGSRGELVEVVTPSGQKTARGYDALGRLVLTEHGGGGSSTRRYVADALVETTAPDGTRWRMGYDALLRLRWIENPAAERCRFDYDESSRLIREVSFTEAVTEYELDALGRVFLVKRGDGTSVRLHRDRAGRIVKREHSNGQQESFELDDHGELCSATNGATTVQFLRNERAQVVREVQRAGGWEFAIDYEYNALGQVVNRSFNTGWSVSSRCSEIDGRPEEIELRTARGADKIAFEHDKAGHETARRRVGGPGAILTQRNALGMPEKVTVLSGDTVVRERTYEWAKQGPLSKITDSGGGERKFELDVMGRPLEIRGLNTTESCRYTPLGIPVPADGNFSMARGGRPIRLGDTTLSWDARGRLAARQSPEPARSWRYTYDDDDRLIEALRGDGRSVRYMYDALGRRLCETSAGASTWFGWEGDSVVEEAATSGHRTYRVFGADGFSPVLEAGSDGSRLIANDGAGTPWLLLDQQGEASVQDLTAWGEVASSEGTPTTLRNAGQRADTLTGLHYNRNRYVAPDLRIFTTPDPLGFRASPNEIGFVPNTTYYMDPLGLLTIVQASDDPVIVASSQRLQAANPGSTIVRAADLQPNSLTNESQVIVNSHGSPGSIQWAGGSANGSQVAQSLNAAGFDGSRPGAQVSVTACNSATPGFLSQSVAQGVATGTGAQTFGARSNSPLRTNLGIESPLPGYPQQREVPGVMAVGSNNDTSIHNGAWVSTQPRPWYQIGENPQTTGTAGSPTQWGSGTTFGQ